VTFRKLARLHQRVAHLRQNAIHQATTSIVAKTKPDHERPSVIVLENLNVVGTMQNYKLARTIGDVGLGEFSRQMSYKWYGMGHPCSGPTAGIHRVSGAAAVGKSKSVCCC